MAWFNSERQIDDDRQSLTNMIDVSLAESYSHDVSRNVSNILEVLDQRTDLYKQFWILRYQVQQFQPPFDDKLQKDISFRLTALHKESKFNAKAISETRVRLAVKELIKRSYTLPHDPRRLRKRSKHLLKRLNATIYAYQRWWGRNM